MQKSECKFSSKTRISDKTKGCMISYNSLFYFNFVFSMKGCFVVKESVLFFKEYKLPL